MTNSLKTGMGTSRLPPGAVSAGLMGVLLLGASCSPRPSSLTVPLIYSPTETPNTSFSLPPGAGKVYVMPVDDQRPDKSKIGENTQQPATVPILAATPSPADWVHDTTADLFRKNGLIVVNSADEADVLVTISLTTFWAKECPDYIAQVAETVKAQDKTGKELWTGSVSGDARNWDGDLQVTDYQQVLSDSLDNATIKLLANPDFERALVPPTSGTDTVVPPAH